MASDVPSAGELVEAAKRVILDYAYGIDDKDWVKVRRCFHDDAVDRHEDHNANVSEFLEWVERRHAAVLQAVHSMTSLQVSLSRGHVLSAESYCHLYQGMTADCQETLFTYGLGSFDGLPIRSVQGRDPRICVEMHGLVRYSDELQWRRGVGVRFNARRVKFLTLTATRKQGTEDS